MNMKYYKMEKKFKNGLVLGKFFPPTLGHFGLIDFAKEQCENIFVIVCSIKSEEIPGEYRYNWVSSNYINSPNVIVKWCNKELPQSPDECESTDEFYFKHWCPVVHEYINDLNVVFTSEDYGDEFAKYLGVDHVLFDKDRKIIPVSGTKVRKYPYGDMWNFITDDVKKYFKKKIVIVGPESTGKTTLVKKLAEYYNTKYVEEFGREYTNNIPAKNMIIKDYENIALVQKMLIDKHDYDLDKVLFVDTEAITTKLFGELYIKDFKSDIIENIINKQEFDLYLLLNVDVPWVDDGTRDFPDKREEHFNMIKQELIDRKLPFVVISGDSYNNRFNNSLLEINKLFKNGIH